MIQLTPTKKVFNFCEPYVIAEIGANHNGDMVLAKKMIDSAVECGVDAVKFQSWTPDSLIAKEEYFTFYYQYIDFINIKKESQGSGGNFYATAKKRISLRFANYINNAVKENKLLYRDAYKLTSLKGDTYSRFMKEQLLQS